MDRIMMDKRMKMIYTITCQRAKNYGAVLQTYALAEFLKRRGRNVQVIDYNPRYLNRSLNNRGALFDLIRAIIQYPERHRGNRVFGDFLNKYVPLTPTSYSSCAEMKNKLPPADVYIAGSDQIWNMNLPNGNDDSYFLRFAGKQAIKIAYAASFAMDEMSEKQKKRVKMLTDDFHSVSIREKQGADLFLAATGRKATVVMDPVFLLTKDDWIRISDRRKYSEKYILIYAFYRQKEIFTYAKRLAIRKRCKVLFVNTPFLDYIMPCDKYMWCTSPEAFLSLIYHAESVVTNSFHGLAFSLIFHKDVHIFYPHRTGNSRIRDMVDQMGLQDRIVRNKIIGSRIDYGTIDEKLNTMINNSKEFIIKATDMTDSHEGV